MCHRSQSHKYFAHITFVHLLCTCCTGNKTKNCRMSYKPLLVTGALAKCSIVSVHHVRGSAANCSSTQDSSYVPNVFYSSWLLSTCLYCSYKKHHKPFAHSGDKIIIITQAQASSTFPRTYSLYSCMPCEDKSCTQGTLTGSRASYK